MHTGNPELKSLALMLQVLLVQQVVSCVRPCEAQDALTHPRGAAWKQHSEIMWWLPEDTEGILVTSSKISMSALWPNEWNQSGDKAPEYWPKGVLKSSKKTGSHDRKPVEQFDFAKIATLANVGPLLNESVKFPIGAQYQLARQFFDENIDLVLSAGRNGNPFRHPHWERCSIVLFRENRQEALLTSIKKFAIGEHRLERNVIFVLELYPATDVDQAIVEYVCSPRPDVLLTSNDLDFLSTVLRRMNRPTSKRALDTVPFFL